MYSTALCSHVNNIYNKLAEIQQQLPHSNQHMNTGNVIQIEAPDFDPDIDEALPIVRCNLAVHRSVTPFIIRQPIWRPRLLEKVYKPMRTSH